MSNLDNAYSIIPPSGEYGKDWPVHLNIPQGASGGISTGGWTADNLASGNFGNEGFVQQTFLGASITTFDMSAGFGSSASTMNISLVNDEFNISDGTPLGDGDDPYHNGKNDEFLPPPVGTPVFFKFGKNPATIEQAFRQTFDDIYKIQTLPEKTANNPWGIDFPTSPWNPEEFDELPPYHLVDRDARLIQDRSILWKKNTYSRGRAHFNFGGILQSYTQNKGAGGKPVYSVQLTDPREILSNVAVLLNNYQGTTFNNKNLINLYGFLEYDPSNSLLSKLAFESKSIGIVDKFVNNLGEVQYIGVLSSWSADNGWEKIKPKQPADIFIPDKAWFSKNNDSKSVIPASFLNLKDQYSFGIPLTIEVGTKIPAIFPITGQGFSRRSDKGMPLYRIIQGLEAIFQYKGKLPSEYISAGFGGVINFRGYNYVVDFSGIPVDKIPSLYYMDFDQIDLLSFAQELCDIISHELYVTLLPVIDHPACEFLYEYNQDQILDGKYENIIAGIIRVDAIDKTKQPKYGAIKSYLDNLESRGISVDSQDIGYELSNVTTDKFIVGAQEVGMYFFSSERDRDTLWTWNQTNSSENRSWLQQLQWDLRTQEQQQILPYYGLIGKRAISIPRGFGSYQQILLDATSLNAYGVGNYYIATEMELRSALISYEKWKDFLLSYNDVYIEDISEHRAFISALSSENGQFTRVLNQFFASVKFDELSDGPAKSRILKMLDGLTGREFAVTVPRCVWHSDKPYVNEYGYPASPCSPPFGYPLYYRRATSIGIVEAGIGKVIDAKLRLVKNNQHLQQSYENINHPMLSVPQQNDILQWIKRIDEQIVTFTLAHTIGAVLNPLATQSEEYQNLLKMREQYYQIWLNYEQMKQALNITGEQITLIQNLKDGPLGKFLFNLEKTAKKHDENARKVYEFVKSIADECLGKKFLVRIPKSCNVGYSDAISTFDGTNPFNIQYGPFGFQPRPISSDIKLEIGGVNYNINNVNGNTGLTLLALNGRINNNPLNLWHHYLQDYTLDKELITKRGAADKYSYGALKGNFNPFSENWEWNYKPEPQGGFFDFTLLNVNISALEALKLGIPWDKMPPVIQHGLCPVDLTNLITESNRIQCYVRYNHSELLDFTGVSRGDMTQQLISRGGQFIPDIVEELPNNNIDERTRFEAIAQTREDQEKKQRQPPSMAFVKCSLDEKFYMPPKLTEYNLIQFGREYRFSFTSPQPSFGQVLKCGNNEPVIDQVIPAFHVPEDGGVDGTVSNWVDFARTYDSALDGWIINTEIDNLDDEHVYALVTVPGRIKSIIDTRWNDAQNQAFQAILLKHLMTQDTVHISQFDKPNLPVPGVKKFPCGPPPLFNISVDDALEDVEQTARIDAEKTAKEYGLIGATKVRGIFGLAIDREAYIPGKVSDWLQLSLEEISSARNIAKKVITGSITNNPSTYVSYVQPSPVYPDLVVLPLMSMERCYGPWLSMSSLNPEEDPRIKYSDIGGKVEFIKDEKLAPWSYAGYQLMNEAGALQAQFSNSLLLFSERGGFAFPDAPTGIALAKALMDGGPLITSISIGVSQAGVKTTVKLDLYTSRWGKLAKQKEMAIDQIVRERQKLRDEKNNAIRRGIGKSATSADLVNTVMNNGGQYIINLVNSVTSQIQTNRELGQSISEGMIVAGADGAVSYANPSEFSRALATTDNNTYNAVGNNTAVVPPANMYEAVSPVPSPTLVSVGINSTSAITAITDNNLHHPTPGTV